MRGLVLRMDAPLMSFGTVLVDHHGFTDRFPGVSLLTGLLGNALGWHHRDADRLQDLQERVVYAARWDVPPRQMVDYHTVDLGQPKMAHPGWTTRGTPEHRGKGRATQGTHQRLRHYWMDGLMTVVLSLREGTPTLDQVLTALRSPARPLFLGRKTCLPARPLVDPTTPVVEGDDLVSMLQVVPLWDRKGEVLTGGWADACWPAEFAEPGRGEMRRVYDRRDWANQVPTGSSLRLEGRLEVKAP